MSKRSSQGRGNRPNPPPLNWWDPKNPAVRSVSGALPDEELPSAQTEPRTAPNTPATPLPHTETAKSAEGLVAVRLGSDNWKALLQCLYLQGQYRDQAYEQWRLRIRREVLLSVNSNSTQPTSSVLLSPDDWRTVLAAVETACRLRGKSWIGWYSSLEKHIVSRLETP
jgi:hypothetical protein